MLISELSRMVHQNAVAHGWWDEERSPEEVVALIHSEWSEALEEARAGRPMVYYLCASCDVGPCLATPDTVAYACGFDKSGRKPEGIAVELIDGCIRILDYIGKLDIIEAGSKESDTDIERLYNDPHIMAPLPYEKLPELVAYLHMCTADATRVVSSGVTFARVLCLMLALSVAMGWVKKQGIDPLALLLEKHEYNKSRPLQARKEVLR